MLVHGDYTQHFCCAWKLVVICEGWLGGSDFTCRCWQPGGQRAGTCSGVVESLGDVCSGLLSWDCGIHEPVLTSLNIVSFSNRLSCLAIGSTRGPLEETSSTPVSLLPTVSYQSKLRPQDRWTTDICFIKKTFLSALGKIFIGNL